MNKRQNSLINTAVLIQQETAKEADMIGFLARTLTQSSIPHSDPKTNYYERTNGLTTLSITGKPKIGLPYGSIPRLLLTWICTEAVKTQSPILNIGSSQAEFLRALGLQNTGYYIKQLDEQSRRLFSSLISIEYSDNEKFMVDNILIAKKAVLCWDKTTEKPVWGGQIMLTNEFYDEITQAPVPLDLRVMQALKKSPLAMDIYAWLIYRIFLLRMKKQPQVKIPWKALQAQFGSGYGSNSKKLSANNQKKIEQQALRDFRHKFLIRLKEVVLFYPEIANSIDHDERYLILRSAKLHIRRASNNLARIKH